MPSATAQRDLDKRAIAAAFSRAATGYNTAAKLQQESGEILLHIGRNHLGKSVLDAGCGTGYFSKRWRQLGKKVLALDLAAGMLHQARLQKAADIYMLGDIEHIPLVNQKIDICFSNLVVQWCNDLSTALAELYRVTRPGGIILFSTLAEGSLTELGKAWQCVDGRQHINNFLSLAQIREVCKDYSHNLEYFSYKLFFNNVITLMRSLKDIGATHLNNGREKGLRGRQSLDILQAAYPIEGGKYPLSYHLVFVEIYRN